MKRTVIALLLVALGASPLRGASLTLRDCIARGLENNPNVKAYRIQIDEAKEGVREAAGSFLPSVTLGYTYNNLHNADKKERDTDYIEQTNETMSARISQPLFMGGGNVAGLKRARHAEEYRRYELQSAQLYLVRSIRTSFYDILKAQEQIQKWQESVKRLENQQRIANAWVAQRLAPRLRVLEVEVELSNARQNLIVATTNLKVAQANLREALSMETSESFSLNGKLEDPVKPACSGVDSCIRKALGRRAELQMIGRNIDMSREDTKIIAARSLPQVSLDAAMVDYDRDYEKKRYNDEDRTYYTVSLNVTMRPFQGGRNIAAYRRQKATTRRMEAGLQHQREAIITEVHTSFQQMEESRARLSVAIDTLREAEEAYRVAQRSVELGVSSLEDLLNAELRLTRAELSMIETRHAIQIAAARLDYAVGGM
ncbi:MAG: TolC family protein [Deltaproteobacteria bacterium]|nr:TolC family protein [Deltaproteobacteria bacterium]